MPKYLYIINDNMQSGGKDMILGIENLKEKQKEKEKNESD